MTLEYTPINRWFNGPHLPNDEEIVASSVAQHAQRGIARAGLLFLTNKRLIFLPNRAEALLGGCPWSMDLPDVAQIGRDPPRLSLFRVANGGWHERLLIHTVSGVTEYFVVGDLVRIEAELLHGVLGTTYALEATRGARGTSRLRTYLANMTWMHFVLTTLCLVVAATVLNDDVRDDTSEMTIPLYISIFLLAPVLRDLFVFNLRSTVGATTAAALFSIVGGLLLLQMRAPTPTPLPLQALRMLVATGLASYLSVHFVLRSDDRFKGAEKGDILLL